MKIWILRLLFFSIFMALFIVGGRFLPSLLKNLDIEFGQVKDTVLKKVVPKPEIQEDWKENLVEQFIHQNQISEKWVYKKTETFWKLFVPRGIPMTQYAVQLKKIGDSLGLNPPKGKTIASQNSLIVLDFYNNQDSLKILFRYAKSFKPGSARLALLWTGLDSISKGNLKKLLSKDYFKTLILSTNHEHKEIVNSLNDSLFEKVVKIPLEPINYPYRNPGKETILIHHSKEQVKEKLRKSLSSYENISGFATSYGSRAIENKDLIRQIVSFVRENQITFLDLTQSQRSVTKSICTTQKSVCYTSKISKSNKIDMVMSKKISTAKKYGSSILVLKYSPTIFHNLNTYFKNKNLKDVGVDLVKLSELSG